MPGYLRWGESGDDRGGAVEWGWVPDVLEKQQQPRLRQWDDGSLHPSCAIPGLVPQDQTKEIRITVLKPLPTRSSSITPRDAYATPAMPS